MTQIAETRGPQQDNSVHDLRLSRHERLVHAVAHIRGDLPTVASALWSAPLAQPDRIHAALRDCLDDRTVVVLRPYTDAYLFHVPDDNLVGALGGEPVRVPLPDELQGEAIAFEPDGSLVSASEGVGQPIRIVAGAAALVAPKPVAQTEDKAAEPTDSADQPGGKDGLPALPAIGLTVLIVGGLFMLMRRRRG